MRFKVPFIIEIHYLIFLIDVNPKIDIVGWIKAIEK